jgi:hypothetical protein
VVPDGGRGEVDPPQALGVPRWRYGRGPPWRGAGRQGRKLALEKALEHALHGIAAAQHHSRNRGHGVPLRGQEPEVRAAALGMGRRLVHLAEGGHLGVGQRR